ncbi:hypothetical protein KBD08_02400 [Candidatus Babeliales bacterium]|nr:hypothetical protein [Candidatus Babeliales bacterium]
MKGAVAIILMYCLCINYITYAEYELLIEQNAQNWQNNNAPFLKNEHNINTMIDILVLSYKITSTACAIIIAKLTVQEEILKFQTPSLIESWQTNMQIMHNDTARLDAALLTMKDSHLRFTQLVEEIRNLGHQIMHVNPQPTQTIICELKKGLLSWAKSQQDISEQIDQVQTEFLTAIHSISDIKTMLETTSHNSNNYLKETAGCVSKTYKDIESVLNHVTHIRKASMYNIHQFFTYFFTTYYQKLCQLALDQSINVKIIDPNAFCNNFVIL